MRRFLLLVLAVSVGGCVGLMDLDPAVERSGPLYGPGSQGNADLLRGAERYVLDVDRAVQLDRQQARRLRNLLIDRTTRFAEDEGPYAESPFPRSRWASDDVHRFWRDTDREIESHLAPRQRDRYRRFVRQFEAFLDSDAG